MKEAGKQCECLMQSRVHVSNCNEGTSQFLAGFCNELKNDHRLRAQEARTTGTRGQGVCVCVKGQLGIQRKWTRMSR